jgi:methylthioribose-1-phosphate isomerase
MKVDHKHYRTIWEKHGDARVVQIIDQRRLPFEFVVEDICSVEQMCTAIRDMHVRGAGLIGAAAGYGMYLAAIEAEAAVTSAADGGSSGLDASLANGGSSADFDAVLQPLAEQLDATRPTAINLSWAIGRQLEAMAGAVDKVAVALKTARAIADEDADSCWKIGEHGLEIIAEIAARKNGEPVNVLTHCNAGWLAFVDNGTATAPIYAAHRAGIPVHVWVDETRPRNQGARLTAWELGQEGVPHTVIADNVGGHLMQHGMVDLVLVGSDRTTFTGDVGNKIGTYLKALAAKDNGVPFYAALPSSTIDWQTEDGVAGVPIEQRGDEEVRYAEGVLDLSRGDGVGTAAEGSDERICEVRLTPKESAVANYAFDITPARLVTGIITERGICRADREGVLGLFPERR